METRKLKERLGTHERQDSQEMQEHGVSEQHILKQRDMQTIYTHQVFRKLGNTRECS